MLSIIQKKLDEKKVTILTCSGGKFYHCNKNLFSLKSICYSCKKIYLEVSISLKEILNNLHTKIRKKHKESYKFENDKWHSYLYKKNYDNGLASYSSYVALTRDRDLDGFLSLKTMRNLVSLQISFLIILKKHLKRKFMIRFICLMVE